MSTDKVPAYALEASKLASFAFEPYWPKEKLRICVTGAGGFIASHLCRRLKGEGHVVVACDWKRNEHMAVSFGRGKKGGSFPPGPGPHAPLSRAPIAPPTRR